VSASSADLLAQILRPSAEDDRIDRKALAGLLAGVARSVEPRLGDAEAGGVRAFDPRLQELRTVLVGDEIRTLARLTGEVEDPEQLAAAIARVLPTAIASTDARLGQVLAPALEKATEISIRRDPRALINILYPLIVPAIRKSIGEAIDNTFQSLNEALKQSLTWRGLKWRFEALWTGKSFAEVVLKHSLVYQVEHVFLIHQRSGLLISHVAAEKAASQDPLLVSSMLSAIQDFIRDSFQGAEHQGVDTLRLGDFRLWCESGPFAMLVAVIRGNPPEQLHARVREVLCRIHAERHQALEAFDGDNSGFADVDAHLAEIAGLRQQVANAPRRGFPWLVALLGLLLLGLAAAGGRHWWHEKQLQEQQERIRAEEQRLKAEEVQRWAGYVDRLRATPGIVVTQSGERDGKYFVSGLRDPLAAEPRTELAGTEIAPERVVEHWQPYLALDPQFVLERLKASLQPPPGVTLRADGDRIVAEGEALPTWISRARAVAHQMPAGGPVLDVVGVRDLAEGAVSTLRDEIQSHEIHFNTNEALPAPGQEAALDEVAADLKRLSSLSTSLHVAAHVALTGHSDDTGPGGLNLSLSLSRAAAVAVLLKKRGVDSDILTVRGAGPLEPLQPGATDEARSANRRVSFTVWLEE
jgi:outer membrane protein OmpA-like peptidoglycan-associated protein